nr:polysaccharide biosynthesis protein [Bacteroides sp. BFG-257]
MYVRLLLHLINWWIWNSLVVVAQMLAQDIHVMTVPPLSDCLDDGIIKDIHIEDWLRREPIQVDIRKIAAYVEGHRILITGAAGTVGQEIVRQLAALNPYQLILVDQAESPFVRYSIGIV